MRVPRAVVATSDASLKTAARRTTVMKCVRKVVSGGDEGKQMTLEVKCLPSHERQKMLQCAGLHLNVPEGQGLAMRIDVGLPWNKLRVLKK